VRNVGEASLPNIKKCDGMKNMPSHKFYADNDKDNDNDNDKNNIYNIAHFYVR
jgi:hypothetical protein